MEIQQPFGQNLVYGRESNGIRDLFSAIAVGGRLSSVQDRSTQGGTLLSATTYTYRSFAATKSGRKNLFRALSPGYFDHVFVLQQLLCTDEPVKFMDSTMLPVCTAKRADRHRVAARIARFSRNHQGWHFGFKLHVSVTKGGHLCALALTPADVYDAQVIPHLLNSKTKIAVGDSHYGASVMRKKIWQQYGTVIIAPPHYKQKKKLMAPWQHALLNMRSKIEAVFDVLKQHLLLVSSFPRSVHG